MENNVVKSNCLEVLDNNDVITMQKTEALPVVVEDRRMLLPVLIPKDDDVAIAIQNLRSCCIENPDSETLKKIIKATVKVIATLTRALVVSCSSAAVFIGTSAIIVASVAIITKNMINLNYDVEPDDGTTYNIFGEKQK